MQQWFGVDWPVKTKGLALQLLLISKCSHGATLAQWLRLPWQARGPGGVGSDPAFSGVSDSQSLA